MGRSLDRTTGPLYIGTLLNIMYTLIVMSKDRPAQLDALLSSIAQNAPFFETRVIYKASTRDFQDGYDKLRYEGWHRALFFKETNFKEDISNCLHGKYITFATDDGIFFRDLKQEWFEYSYVLDENVACISLRLGQNTPYNNYYSGGIGYAQPRLVRRTVNGFMTWEHRKATGNFAYPLSVDAHIFRNEVIVPLIDKTDFSNPNFLEGNLQRWNSELPPLMVAPLQSAYVGNSINRVQSTFENFAGGFYRMSPEALNRKFLQGYRIDWERFPFDEVKSPHHEFEVHWK